MGKLFFIVTLLISSNAVAQFIVKGVVYDHENKPLPGVNVLEPGSEGGTTTDIDGKFSINCYQKTPTLFFSFIGFETAKVDVDASGFVSLTLKLDPALAGSLSGEPYCCIFYDRHTMAGFSSGFRYTPVGFKIENFTPYAFGISPMLSSGIEWRTNQSSNRYVDIFLRRHDILRIANSPLSLFGEYKTFRAGSNNVSEINLAPDLTLRRVRFSIGYTRQQYSNTEQSRSGQGIIGGVYTRIFRHLAFDLKSKYVLDRYQHDLKVSWDMQKPQLTLSAGYQRIGNLDEATASLQYRFSY